MHYFCTLFDNLYLPRGLALYRSLARHDDNFHLYILTMDDNCFHFLKKMNLPHVTLVPLADVETPTLRAAKKGRTHAEYCWTLTPVVIDHCLSQFNLPHCVYVDADIYFFSSPAPLFDTTPKTKSVLVSKHNFSPDYASYQEASGVFCVEYIMFKNNTAGKKILHTWKDQCVEKCFLRPEDGLCGDQKYLDEWPKKYKDDIHIMPANYHAAPWSIKNYKFYKKNSVLHSGAHPLIFFHFHDIKPEKTKKLLELNHQYYSSLKNFILFYKPYFQEIALLEQLLDRKIAQGVFYYALNYYRLCLTKYFFENIKEMIIKFIPRPIKKIIKKIYLP